MTQFLFQLTLYFQGDPDTYSDDRAKVLSAASFLEGVALQWIQPFVLIVPPPPILSISQLSLSPHLSHASHQLNAFAVPSEPPQLIIYVPISICAISD